MRQLREPERAGPDASWVVWMVNDGRGWLVGAEGLDGALAFEGEPAARSAARLMGARIAAAGYSVEYRTRPPGRSPGRR